MDQTHNLPTCTCQKNLVLNFYKPASPPLAAEIALTAVLLKAVLLVRAIPVIPPMPAPDPSVRIEVPAWMKKFFVQSISSKFPFIVEMIALALELTPVPAAAIPIAGVRPAIMLLWATPTTGVRVPELKIIKAMPPIAKRELPTAATAP